MISLDNYYFIIIHWFYYYPVKSYIIMFNKRHGAIKELIYDNLDMFHISFAMKFCENTKIPDLTHLREIHCYHYYTLYGEQCHIMIMLFSK